MGQHQRRRAEYLNEKQAERNRYEKLEYQFAAVRRREAAVRKACKEKLQEISTMNSSVGSAKEHQEDIAASIEEFRRLLKSLEIDSDVESAKIGALLTSFTAGVEREKERVSCVRHRGMNHDEQNDGLSIPLSSKPNL